MRLIPLVQYYMYIENLITPDADPSSTSGKTTKLLIV